MIAKRVVALVLMAMVSTVSPAVYQKGLEPRLGALDAKVEINSFTYDAARSGKDTLCYKAWITVKNPNPYEVILSQLDLDMFYATTYHRGYDGKELERFKKIGSFNTTQEYTVPASKGINVPESEWGAIASFDDSTHKIYQDPLWGMVSRDSGGKWTDVPVFAYIYLSTQFEGNATEEAISQLLALGTITVDLQGDLIIGPLKMPFSLENVELNLNIWGQIFTLIDVVGAYQVTVGAGIASNDIYFVQAKIQNPSGNPFILKDYRFDLYEEGGTTPIALGIDSRYLDQDDVPLTAIFDPDINQTKVENGYSTRVPLRDIAWGTYDNLTQRWARAAAPAVEFSTGELEEYVIFGLNFSTVQPDPQQATAKDNIAKFMDRLLNDAIITDLELKGTAKIALGTTGGTGTINGIEVNFGAVANWEDDPNRFKPSAVRVALTQTWFFQKSLQTPQNIQDRMQLGAFQVTKIDVNKQTNLITLNATSSVNFTNPYRIEMNFTEFGSAIDHDDNISPIDAADRFSAGTESRIMQIWRGYRTMVSPTAEPLANTTVVTTNVTIGYNTDNFDTDSGLGQIYKDIGFWESGTLQTFNLTNPFRVLGPGGVKLEDQENKAPNWMEAVDYLIQHNVDPLMLLHEVNTTGETYTGVDAYTTGCSSFGTEKYTTIGSVIYEPADMPGTNSHITGDQNYQKPYHTPFQFRDSYNQVNWTDYWWDENRNPGSGPGDGLKLNDQLKNQWVFAAAYGTVSDMFNRRPGNFAWVPDWGWFTGAIWQKDSNINRTMISTETGPVDLYNGSRFFPELIRWRFSTESADYHGQYGYWYDFSELEKGYHLVMQDTDAVLARQNITIPTAFNSPDIQVMKATLSMSYRYPFGDAGSGDVAVLGISNQTGAFDGPSYLGGGVSTFQYLYPEPGQTDFGSIEGGQYFWSLGYPGSVSWSHAAYDVTGLIQTQLARMATGLPKWVNASKIEIAFGKSHGVDGDPVAPGIQTHVMYFDDVMLRIEYKNMTKLSTITPSELFSYIEENDNEEGNMWNMMDQLNFNATKFTAFLEGTLGHGSAPGASMNFIDFMKQSGAEPETMPELLQNNYLDLGGSEPVNFLQMLNQTKYRATKAQYLAPPYVNTAPTAPYGPRDNNLANWVVEDPLKASQVFAQSLMDALYTKASGGFLGPADGASGDEAGEELWTMLENLEVYLPWVCMYLVQNGWSKDDIFDLLEALGIGMEVRTQPILDHAFYNQKATGSLRVNAYMEIWVRFQISIPIFGSFVIGPFSISSMADPINATFKLGMGETLLDPVTDLYFLLGAPGTAQMDVDGSGDFVNESSVIPLQVAGATLPDPVEASQFSSQRKNNPISLVDWIELTPASRIGIKAYTLAIWVHSKSTISSYAPLTVPAEIEPYTQAGQGLSIAGCQQFFQNYRQNVKFQGETFIQTGGNPISLFQFLDDAFFLNKETAGHPDVDYSSYTLFNHYNAKAIDFIDILTDYNRTAGKFDSLGNGICDEWTAPTTARNWEGSASHYDSALTGYGGSYRDNRIYKQTSEVPIGGGDCLQYSNERTGTIIWTDSPSLARVSGAPGDAHRQGNVYLGDPAARDFFQKGAPKVVNLLDMFAWLSIITGKPDPEELVNWLTGQLPNSYYDCIGNGDPKSDPLGPAQQKVNKGLGYDKTWTLFKNITLNATGMVNWLENVKFLSPFKFFYMMNQTDQAMDPLQLLFYATNQNWVLRPDGSIAFVYHNALGTSNAVANYNLWNVFNSTWWTQKDPYGADPMFNLAGPTYATFPHLFYQKLRDLEEDGNGAYNLFVMMEALTVDPVSWLNIAQWRYTIKPLELFAIYNTLNYDWAIQNRTGGKSRIRVNCTVSLQVNGLNLNAGIDQFNWALEDRELTADYHLRNFIIAANLYRNSYVYYPYSGLP